VPFVKRVERKERQHTFKILFFGQIKKVKGLDVLLRAVAILKQSTSDFELRISGKIWRDDANYYQNIIEESKLAPNVKLDLRFVPDEETFDIFNDACIVVLPYKEIYQSGVLLKAMSFGRAVVCSDLPPFQELVADGKNGFLFRSEDPASLADKLLEIFNNRQMLERIEDEAYKGIVVTHDWNKIGFQTNTLYNKALSGYNTSSST
jgi:glycosyltransferase involved in cell wall biosynthesis